MLSGSATFLKRPPQHVSVLRVSAKKKNRQEIAEEAMVNVFKPSEKNLYGDYVVELLNKCAKSRVKPVGPNYSSDLIMCIGKTMNFCYDLRVQLERQVKTGCLSGDHKSQNIQGDLVKIIRGLQKAEVFEH